MQSNIAGQLGTLFKFTSLGNLVSNLWGVAFSIGAIAAFLFMGLGALTWITGGGEKAKVEEAKERITQGIVGLAILAVSYAVALLVQQFLGLNVFGSGGNGGPPNGCQYSCEGQVPKGTPQCRNQDCQMYVCDGKCWIPQGTYEPMCQAHHHGCYQP
jgi:hypothetical protein